MSRPTVEDRGEALAEATGELQDAAINFAKKMENGHLRQYSTQELARSALKFARAVRRAVLNPTRDAR